MAIESGYTLLLTTVPGIKDLPFIVYEIDAQNSEVRLRWHLGMPGKPSKLISSNIYTLESSEPEAESSEKIYEWLDHDLRRFICQDIGVPLVDQQFRSSQLSYFYAANQSDQLREALQRLAATCLSAELRDQLLAVGVTPV